MNVKRNKLLATAGVIIVLIAIIEALKLFFPKQPPLETVKEKISNKSIGSENAPVKIIEYTDFECPACAKGALIVKVYAEKYPESMYVQYKHYPLNMNQGAFRMALYAECAAKQDLFWPLHYKFFSQQWRIKKSVNKEDVLKEMAVETGLDPLLLENCLTDPKAREIVEFERLEGKLSGVSATPTYFINEEMVVGWTNLGRKIDQYLSGAKNSEEKNP